eukprot:6239035-Alexandrium_andersonii.AAC.1
MRPAAYVAKVWVVAGLLAPTKAAKVRARLVRFMVSAKLLPAKRLVFTVPTASKSVISAVRRAVRGALAQAVRSKDVFILLCSRTVLARGKPTNVAQLAKHRSAALAVDPY